MQLFTVFSHTRNKYYSVQCSETSIQIVILFDCEMKPKRSCFVFYGTKDFTERVTWVYCCSECLDSTYWAVKYLKVLKPVFSSCYLLQRLYRCISLVSYLPSIKIWITSLVCPVYCAFDGFFIKSWNMYAMAPSRPFLFYSSHVIAICYKSIKLNLLKFLDKTNYRIIIEIKQNK